MEPKVRAISGQGHDPPNTSRETIETFSTGMSAIFQFNSIPGSRPITAGTIAAKTIGAA